MNFLTLNIIVTLGLIAALHLYWVLGGQIGLNRALPTTAEGKLLLRPGKFATALVAVVLFVFAFVAYKLRFESSVDEIYIYAGWIISALFFLRAIGEFHTVGFFKKVKQTPFAQFDTFFYSPLCVYLAFCYACLAYEG